MEVLSGFDEVYNKAGILLVREEVHRSVTLKGYKDNIAEKGQALGDIGQSKTF